MKKKFVFMIMVAVLLAAIVAPTTVAAKGPKVDEETPFWAAGSVAFTGTQMHKTVETGHGVVDIAVHETVDSDYITSDWGAIGGGAFTSSHTGVAKLNLMDWSLEGSIVGSFTLFAPDGSTLRGHMWMDVDAPLGEDGYPAVINDIGTFKINNGTGILKGIKASGYVEAQLYWDDNYGTYVGGIYLEGLYR